MSYPLYKTLAAVVAAALVAACGGGAADGSAPTPGTYQFVAEMRARSLSASVASPPVQAASVLASTSVAGVTPDMVLDWAEYKFPSLFPKAVAQRFPAVVYEGATYNARAYAGAWGTRYLGITADGRVFGLGDFTGNLLQGFETVSFWAAQVEADRCLVNEAACAASEEPTLTAGVSNSALVQRSGDVLVWGDDAFGVMLGSGAPEAGSAARRLSIDATSVSVGTFHFVAVKRDGSVVGWGQDTNGALGSSTTFAPWLVPSPRALSGLVDVRSAVASSGAVGGMTTALKNDGTLWHLPGTVTPNVLAAGATVTPLQIAGLSDVQSLTRIFHANSGSPDVLALKADGSVVEIAYGASRSLTGTTYTATVRPIAGLGATRSASCSTTGHCLFLLRDGRVFALGRNSSGELGSGSTADSPTTPVQVVGLSGIRSVAAASRTSAAVGDDGRLWTWGSAQYSGRANAQGADAPAPVLVPGINDAVEVTAGVTHFLLRRSDGAVWGWGANSLGQVGVGTGNQVFVPERVPGIQRD